MFFVHWHDDMTLEDVDYIFAIAEIVVTQDKNIESSITFSSVKTTFI